MKRSRSLTLILMGSLLIGVQGCGEQKSSEEFSAFSSVDECITSGLFSDKECKEFALSAIKESPKFSSKEECERQFGLGECQNPSPVASSATVTNGTVIQQHSGSMWTPLLMGFMAGRMMNGGRSVQGAQPLYRDSSASSGTTSYRTATGDVIKTDSSRRITNPSPKIKQSLGHVAKPVTGRTGISSSKGFSGGSRFGGASS